MKNELKRLLLSTLIIIILFPVMLWAVQYAFHTDIVSKGLGDASKFISNLTPKLIIIALLFVVFRVFIFVALDFFGRHYQILNSSNTKFSGAQIVVRFGLWAAFFLMAVSILFGNITVFATSIGLAGVGLTFAMQKPLLNFVGWLNIMLRNIYTAGDRVQIGQIRGDVKEVNFMNTVLYGLMPHGDSRTGIVITVPNETVLTGDVENYTRISNLLLEEVRITITFESNYHKAQDILSEIAAEVSSTLRERLREEILKEREVIKDRLGVMGSKFIKTPKHPDDEHSRTDSQIQQLKLRDKRLERSMTDLADQYKPRMSVDIKESGIELACQYQIPYNRMSKSRSLIRLAFLEAIKNSKDIHLAYPHMQVVMAPPAKKR
jgi:small-conductance mechanosensitive channel